MLQCGEPLQRGFAYSNAFIIFLRNNFILEDCVMVWVLHVHAFTMDQHALTFCLVKIGEVAMLGLWLATVFQTSCQDWEVCLVAWSQAYQSTMTSIRVMHYYPIIPFRNNFFRDLLGTS